MALDLVLAPWAKIPGIVAVMKRPAKTHESLATLEHVILVSLDAEERAMTRFDQPCVSGPSIMNQMNTSLYISTTCTLQISDGHIRYNVPPGRVASPRLGVKPDGLGIALSNARTAILKR